MYNFLIGKTLTYAVEYFKSNGFKYSVVKIDGNPKGDVDLVVKVDDNNVIYVCSFLMQPTK